MHLRDSSLCKWADSVDFGYLEYEHGKLENPDKGSQKDISIFTCFWRAASTVGGCSRGSGQGLWQKPCQTRVPAQTLVNMMASEPTAWQGTKVLRSLQSQSRAENSRKWQSKLLKCRIHTLILCPCFHPHSQLPTLLSIWQRRRAIRKEFPPLPLPQPTAYLYPHPYVLPPALLLQRALCSSTRPRPLLFHQALFLLASWSTSLQLLPPTCQLAPSKGSFTLAYKRATFPPFFLKNSL